MRDMIDIARVQVTSGPSDVANWKPTKFIRRIVLDGPQHGFRFEFQPSPLGWPSFRPPGWDGDLQYAIWPVVKPQDVWLTAPIVERWEGEYTSGRFDPDPDEPWSEQFPRNWGYNQAGMRDYHPQPGHEMGFFITAGTRRGERHAYTVRERSYIVKFTLGDLHHGEWSFPVDDVPVDPIDPVDPVDPIDPPPVKEPTDYATLLMMLNQVLVRQDELVAAIKDIRKHMNPDLNAKGVLDAGYLGKRPFNIDIIPKER